MGTEEQAELPVGKPEQPQLVQVIRSMRRRLALTQDQFGQLLLVWRNTVGRWERNEVEPSTSTLVLLLNLAEEPTERAALLEALRSRGIGEERLPLFHSPRPGARVRPSKEHNVRA